MRVTVTDSLSDLFEAKLKDEHAVMLAMRGVLRSAPIVNRKGEIVGSRPEINHVDFIGYINECAI